MTLEQRQSELIKQISGVKDENILILLEEELACYSGNNGASGLTEGEIMELKGMADEPAEKDTLSEIQYLQATSKWRTK